MTCRPRQRAHRKADLIRKLRNDLINRDGRDCRWCGKETFDWQHMEGVPQPSNLTTIDHLIRITDGGTSDLSNLVIACRACNQSRSCSGK